MGVCFYKYKLQIAKGRQRAVEANCDAAGVVKQGQSHSVKKDICLKMCFSILLFLYP